MIDLSKFDNSCYVRGASGGKEFAWWVVRSIFFAAWFPVPSSVKVRLLRLFGARIGVRMKEWYEQLLETRSA